MNFLTNILMGEAALASCPCSRSLRTSFDPTRYSATAF